MNLYVVVPAKPTILLERTFRRFAEEWAYRFLSVAVRICPE